MCFTFTPLHEAQLRLVSKHLVPAGFGCVYRGFALHFTSISGNPRQILMKLLFPVFKCLQCHEMHVPIDANAVKNDVSYSMLSLGTCSSNHKSPS